MTMYPSETDPFDWRAEIASREPDGAWWQKRAEWLAGELQRVQSQRDELLAVRADASIGMTPLQRLIAAVEGYLASKGHDDAVWIPAFNELLAALSEAKKSNNRNTGNDY
jgi:hypothetical protein